MPLPVEALETKVGVGVPISYSSGGEEEDSLFVLLRDRVFVIFALCCFLCELFIHCCHPFAAKGGKVCHDDDRDLKIGIEILRGRNFFAMQIEARLLSSSRRQDG
jgi:hypothetical protein